MDEISLDAARRVLPSFGVDAVEVEPISLSENIVFRVRVARGDGFVLRLHRPTYHNLDELVSEQVWTSALSADGVDVPVPRLTLQGNPYATVEVGGEMRYAGMLEWVAGEPMGDLIDQSHDDLVIAARFVSIGRLMAEIHNQATNWCVPGDFSRHALDADGLMGERPFWGRFWESPALSAEQRRCFSAARARLHSILAEHGKDRQTYSLIHADLHPGNVIVNGERLHIIDFDDSGFGWHQYDLAVALMHYHDYPAFGALRDALVAGYRQVRTLSEEAVALLPTFMLVRALASVGWIADRPEHAHNGDLPSMLGYALENTESVLAASA